MQIIKTYDYHHKFKRKPQLQLTIPFKGILVKNQDTIFISYSVKLDFPSNQPLLSQLIIIWTKGLGNYIVLTPPTLRNAFSTSATLRRWFGFVFSEACHLIKQIPQHMISVHMSACLFVFLF